MEIILQFQSLASALSNVGGLFIQYICSKCRKCDTEWHVLVFTICVSGEKLTRNEKKLSHAVLLKYTFDILVIYSMDEGVETAISAVDGLMLCDVSCTIFQCTTYVLRNGAVSYTCQYVFHYCGITFDGAYVYIPRRLHHSLTKIHYE